MTTGKNIIDLVYEEKREKIEKDIPDAIIEMQSEIEWLKKDNAMLKKQILQLAELIGILQKLSELGDIKAQKEAFCAMAECIDPVLKGIVKGFGGKQ